MEPCANSMAGLTVSGSLRRMARSRRIQPPDGLMAPAVTVLEEASIEAVARRVVELIRGDGDERGGGRLVDAAALAEELGVDRSWVYAHRRELGALELGHGPKPRLRFDLERAWSVLAGAAEHAPEAARPAPSRSRRRSRRRRNSEPGLLPVRDPSPPLDTNGDRS